MAVAGTPTTAPTPLVLRVSSAAPVEVSDDLEAEATKAAAALESAYPEEKLKELVEAGGVAAAKA